MHQCIFLFVHSIEHPHTHTHTQTNTHIRTYTHINTRTHTIHTHMHYKYNIKMENKVYCLLFVDLGSTNIACSLHMFSNNSLKKTGL